MTEESNNSIPNLELESIRYPVKTFWLLCAILLINLLYGLLTNPVSGGPKIILGMLFLLFTMFLVACRLIILVACRFLRTRLGSGRILLLSVLVSLGLVILIGLRSLNQLGVADVILVTLLGALVVFYVFRRF